jgi:hypothetical protein
MLTISAASTEYRRIPVSVIADNGSALNPIALTVAVGFSSDADPPDSYTTAAWVTDTSGTDTVYKAQVLVTAGTLTRGVYTAYVKITDNPEIPVIEAGLLKVR